MDAHEQDSLTEQRLKEIEQEVKDKQPLTSDLLDIATTLQETYKGAPNFLMGVEALAKEYGSIRCIRGDGNCFYRAFLYRLVEMIQSNQTDSGQEILSWLKTSCWKNILEMGYDEMTLEVFYDSIVELFEQTLSGKMQDFHEEMNKENHTSDYCTWFLRIVTAAHLKGDPMRFLPFIDQPGMDIEQFCAREVEPMGKECEQLQIIALSEAFSVKVAIAYLDGHPLQHGKVATHTFGPESASVELTFLYRPGHYDILY